ncbi:MAG: hypothetical protein ACTSUF_03560 [Candidatus Heimdallarchaeaceae archaeon]
MEEELKVEMPEAPAVKCSYCGKLYQDEDKQDMGFETDDWAICFKCFKKLCDRVSAK